MLLAGLLLIEAAAWTINRTLFGTGYSGAAAEKQRWLERLPSFESERAGEARLRVAVGNFFGPRQLHPYFGYTFEPGWSPGYNNMGFLSRHDYPYVAAPEELVVGVFGASLALQVYNSEANQAAIAAGLLGRLRERGYEQVTVLSFAQGGFREPQPLFVFLYYLHCLDLAIFVEGFNEAMVPAEQEYPIDFPWITVWNALAREGYGPRELEMVGEIRFLVAAQERATRSFRGPILSRSMLAHLLWRLRVNSLEGRANRLRQALAAPAEGASGKPAVSFANLVPRPFTFEQLQDAYVLRSEEVIRLTRAAGQALGIPVFHVIQPNQYFAGSKPLSQEERSSFLGRAEIGRRVARYYPPLKEIYHRLAAEGLGTIDLSMVFEGVRETVYIDDCCHVGALGRELIGRAMMEEILRRQDLLAEVPAAALRRRLFIARDGGPR